MDFTEQEASDKVGEYVCVIHDHEAFLDVGVPKGTHGKVVGCSYVGGTGTSVPTKYWAVNIRFYPPGKANGVLIHHVGKAQYALVLQPAASEIPRR